VIKYPDPPPAGRRLMAVAADRFGTVGSRVAADPGWMSSFASLLPAGQPAHHTDPLRLAAAAYLARFTGLSRAHAESDLRIFLTWCAERGVDPLAAGRGHPESTCATYRSPRGTPTRAPPCATTGHGPAWTGTLLTSSPRSSPERRGK